MGAVLGLVAIVIGLVCLVVALIFEAMSAMTLTFSIIAIVVGGLVVAMYFWPGPNTS